MGLTLDNNGSTGLGAKVDLRADEGNVQKANETGVVERGALESHSGPTITEGSQKYVGGPSGEKLPVDRITVSYQKVPSEGVMRDVNKAFELDKMGKHSEALEIYRSVGPAVVDLKDSEKAAIYYNRLGLCFHHLGQQQNASDACREALEQKHDFAPAKYNLATIMLALGQKNEALGWLEMAVKAKPELFRDLAVKDRDFNSIREDPTFRKLVGLPALAGAKVPDERITVSFPGLPAGQGVMGKVDEAFALDKAGKFKEALELYRSVEAEVAKLNDPQKSAIFQNRVGLVFHHLGENQIASDKCREALEQNPGFAPAKYNLATIMLALGQKDEALRWLAMAIEAKPEFFKDLALKDRDFNSVRDDAAFNKLVG